MNRLKKLTLTAFALAATASLQAQNERALPRALSGTFGGINYNSQAAWGNRVLQWWYKGDAVTDTKTLGITQIATRRGHTTSHPFSYDVEIVMDNSTVKFDGLSTTLASNLGKGATVVMPKRSVSVPTFGPAANPNEHFGWTKLQRPFVFKGPNLLIQVSQSNFKGTTWTVDGYHMNSVFSKVFYSGKSCGGQLVASATTGGFNLSVSGVRPSSSVIFIVGVDNLRFGNARLPIDLTPLGLTGCELGIAPLVMIAVPATAQGTGHLTLHTTWPNKPTFIRGQALHVSASNANALQTTRVATAIVGNKGMSNVAMNFNGSPWGPFDYNVSAGIFLIK